MSEERLKSLSQGHAANRCIVVPCRAAAPANGLLASSLSGLGTTLDGSGLALLQLDVSGRTDLEDATPLAACVHVQRARLSGNSLTSLAPLGALGSLLEIEAHNNRLTRALDLIPCNACKGVDTRVECTCACSSLHSVNLQNNEISLLGSGSTLHHCIHLTRLLLDGNCLASLLPAGHGPAGLTALTSLRVLGLAHNQLTSVRGLEGAVRLWGEHLSNNCKFEPGSANAILILW
jgi:Leucine-rich repeat (LRR) protein